MKTMNCWPRHLTATALVVLGMLALMLSACAGSPQAPAAVQTTAPATAPNAAPTAAPSHSPETETYWPTAGWRTSTPEEQGMDSQLLADMLAEIDERQIALHSLLIIRNGTIVSESYYETFDQDSFHVLYSATKSFMATLVGIALDKGLIDALDHRVVEYFPDREIANLDRAKEEITLEDLLTMRSGLVWTELEGPDMSQEMFSSDDWVQYVLDKPMGEAPGQTWVYCSGCSHLLSAIVQQSTGMKGADFAAEYLFQPLGISRVRWAEDQAGNLSGAVGLQLTPRDMAKLGYLYLHEGQWDGEQIVSADWVHAATQNYTDIAADAPLGYGYQWFTVDSMNSYAALGGRGQIILVIPDEDMVIVTTAGTDESIFELVERYVLPAVNDAP